MTDRQIKEADELKRKEEESKAKLAAEVSRIEADQKRKKDEFLASQ